MEFVLASGDDVPFDVEAEVHVVDDFAVGVDVEAFGVCLQQTFAANVEHVVSGSDAPSGDRFGLGSECCGWGHDPLVFDRC